MNLTAEEIKAMTYLNELQKERRIVIKPCDKGSGIMIIKYEDYVNACKEHLKD